MAAVFTYSDGRGGYSSHGTQNGGNSSWEFGTPADPETAPSDSQPFTANKSYPQHKPPVDPQSLPRTPERNLQNGTNGVLGQSKPAANIDPSYLSPYKTGVRPTLNLSRSGSEADSLIDLYGHPRGLGEGNVGNSMDRDRAIPPEELYLDDEDLERSRWIHRDKLAIIESHEMQEAGIKLPQQQIRPVSKSKTLREPIRDLPDVPTREAETVPAIERKKRRTRSPVRQEEADETLPNQYDLRTPEEIAADNDIEQNSSNTYRQYDSRKSSSRIPLPRSSPLPIPQGHIERDTPLPRKRGASGNWSGEDGISYNRIRSRGNSVGSQVLLDDPDASYNSPTPASRPASSDSPTTTRTRPHPTHTRKSSIPTNTPTTHPKSRRSSTSASPRTPSYTPRPKSRSGLDPRPQTAVNRPEGEAPWLATMYKPDPRLPPDQQILPTHAKRLQQEQRTQQQQEDTAPPRAFSPLAEHTVHGLQPPSSRDAEASGLQEQAGTEWPLAAGGGGAKQPGTPDLQKPVPGPPVEGGVGYSSPSRVRQGQSPEKRGQPTDPFEKERSEREQNEKRADEAAKKEERKEKWCGCCVVM